MPLHNFVFFLPRTRGAARRPSVLTIERAAENAPLLLTEIGPVQEAAAWIQEIRRSTPQRTIIVDTACQTGRELLCLSESVLNFGDRGFDIHFCLSQLQELIREKIPDDLAGAVDSFAGPVVRLLHSARSGGGQRPCTVSDLAVAEFATNRRNAVVSPDMLPELTGHPLRIVPSFFAEQSKRVLGSRSRYDPARLERLIYGGMATFSAVCQSPFPVRNHLWLFPPELVNNRLDGGNNPDAHAGQESLVNDFLHSVLDGTGVRSKKVQAEYPLASRLVRLADTFLTAIRCSAISLFRDEDNRDRYSRIHAYLNLNLEMWAWSLYGDGTRPQIIGTSRFRPEFQGLFENMLNNRFV